MQNELKSNEWQRLWVLKTFRNEIQKRGTKLFRLSVELVPPGN